MKCEFSCSDVIIKKHFQKNVTQKDNIKFEMIKEDVSKAIKIIKI